MFKEMMDTIGFVTQADPEVGAAMEAELKRQRGNIELIASENIVSPAVMAAMGSVLTNKYAEGYPGHRYYGGCQCVDVVEDIARDRACRLFGAEHANVQPHSGAQANLAVYFCAAERGRYRPGHGSFQRRPPHPRQPCEHERQELQFHRIRRGRKRLSGLCGSGEKKQRSTSPK